MDSKIIYLNSYAPKKKANDLHVPPVKQCEKISHCSTLHPMHDLMMKLREKEEEKSKEQLALFICVAFLFIAFMFVMKVCEIIFSAIF